MDGEIVYDCKIHDRRIKEAISLWDDLVWDMPETMKMANANPQSQDVESVGTNNIGIGTFWDNVLKG